MTTEHLHEPERQCNHRDSGLELLELGVRGLGFHVEPTLVYGYNVYLLSFWCVVSSLSIVTAVYKQFIRPSRQGENELRYGE